MIDTLKFQHCKLKIFETTQKTFVGLFMGS